MLACFTWIAWQGGAPAVAGNGHAALRLLPEDTTLVMSVDVKRLQKSAFARSLVRDLLTEADAAQAVAELRARSGFDIERDLDTVVLAMPSDFDTSEQFWIIIEGRFDAQRQAGLMALVEKESESFERLKHRGVSYIRMDGASELAFLRDHLVLTTRGAMAEIIDVHRGKAASAVKNAALMGLIRSGDTGQDLWAVFVIPAQLRAQIAGEAGGHSVDSFVLSVDMRASLAVALQVNASSPDAAAALATLARTTRARAAAEPTLAILGLDTAIGNTRVTRAGRQVDVRLHIPESDVAMLQQLLLAP